VSIAQQPFTSNKTWTMHYIVEDLYDTYVTSTCLVYMLHLPPTLLKSDAQPSA